MCRQASESWNSTRRRTATKVGQCVSPVGVAGEKVEKWAGEPQQASVEGKSNADRQGSALLDVLVLVLVIENEEFEDEDEEENEDDKICSSDPIRETHDKCSAMRSRPLAGFFYMPKLCSPRTEQAAGRRPAVRTAPL